MTIQQLFRILRARARLIGALFVAVAALGVVAALVIPRSFVASTALVIDAKSANALLGGLLPPQMLNSYMATQVDVITSRRVLERAARDPSIAGDEALLEKWRTQTEQRIAFPVWFATKLESSLEVDPARDSNVVTISYGCRAAEQCARVANAVATAYIDTNLEMKVEPARQYAQWFEARNVGMRDRLDAARRKLSEFQRQHGIVASDERLDIETARLDELSRQLVTVQAERSSTRSRSGESANAQTLPEVVQNPLLAGLKSEIARLEAQREQAMARLGRNHPEIVRSGREIDSLQRRLSLETARIVGSLDTADRVNVAREEEMRAAVDRQKAKVLELKARRDEMAGLEQEVQTAQQAYELVTGRFAETNLESQAQQTNVFVLSPATPPLEPSAPRRLLIVAMSALLGLLLGIGIAIALEMVRRRVRCETDIVEVLGVPVLGALPRTRLAPPAR